MHSKYLVFYFPTTSLLLKVLWDIEVAGSDVYFSPSIPFVFFQHPLAFETLHKKRPPCQICVPPFTAKGLLAPTRPFLVCKLLLKALSRRPPRRKRSGRVAAS